MDGSHTPEQLSILRPYLVDLAGKMRCTLRLIDTLLYENTEEMAVLDEHDRVYHDLYEAQVRIEALEDDLATARAWIEVLQRKVAEFQDDGIEIVYGSVGLTSTAHDVVVCAARRALLAHFHPDRAAAEDKSRMSSQFTAAAAAFDKIAELRR